MRVLLISDLPPCTNHTSGLLINQLCDFLLNAGHEVSAYIIKADVVQVEIPQDKVDRITFEMVRKPKENWGTWKLGAMGSRIGDIFVASTQIPKIIKSIVKFADEMKPDIIWGAVQGQTMTRIIRPAARKTGLPYVVQIFDPINWWFQANKVDHLSQKKIMREFGAMIHNCQCLIGASWNMSAIYKAQYNCRDSVPIMMCFDSKPRAGTHKREAKEKNTFVIAMSGQLYAYGTIMALLVSLKSIHWEYKGKQIIFRIYGANMHFDFDSPCYMEYRGWVPQEDLLSQLEDVDLLYCPYRFDNDFEETARLSFPGKLSTYMNTGVPILIHSPHYSGIADYVKIRKIGYVLESLELEDIVKTIQQIFDDPTRFQIAQEAALILKEELSLSAMRKNFYHALGISS